MKSLFKNSVIVILLFGTTIYLLSCKKEVNLPVVTTNPVSSITKTTVLAGGAVIDNGGDEITDRGICWSTSPNPTISTNKLSSVTKGPSFTSSITGLTANTKYYVRAYATNSAGTSYGNEVSFVTSDIIQSTSVPTLTTTVVTSITSTSAVSGGSITYDGGGDIIARGISWSTIPDWSIYLDDETIYGNGPGSGSFVSYLSNLIPGTTYYVKAYAVNSAGIAFGSTISFATSSEQGSGPWRKITDFPGFGRSSLASFTIGSKVYIGAGYNDGDWPTRDFWEWDPITNAWTRKADYPGNSTGYFVCFAIGTKGYIGTGNDFKTIGFTNEFWEYNPAANSWTQKASLPTTPARAFAAGFSIGTKGYIGIGDKDPLADGGSSGYYRDFWEWDQETDTWTRKADYPGNSRTEAVGFSIGNKGYIGTGYGDGTLQRDFWEWDQGTDTWTKKADFGGIGRTAASGFSIGNKGYIGTGSSVGIDNKDFWEWDQGSNIWTKKADFGGVGRASAAGFSIGNKGYIGTGIHTGTVYASQDFWEYDPTFK